MELGHILSVSARTFAWCALVQLIWVLAWRAWVRTENKWRPRMCQ